MYLQAIFLAIPCLIAGFLAWQNHSLKSDNELLNANLNIALNANESYANEIARISDDFGAGLSALAELKAQNTKEVRYVEIRKEKIIKDDNSTCLGAINDVFSRLREQADTNYQKR